MSIELMLPGVACNLSCSYCYQHTQRDAGHGAIPEEPDWPAVFRALEAEGVGLPDAADPARQVRTGFTVFGGEPLLAPLAQLERVFAWGFERAGKNGMQTNGALITDAHFALFRRYRVNIGLSMDGPGALNDTRWAGSIERTRLMTARSQVALERLCREGFGPTLIVTISAVNAAADRRPQLKAWLRDLYAIGLRYVRLHALEVDHALVETAQALPLDEAVAAMLNIAALEDELPDLHLDPFVAMRRLLVAQDAAEPDDGGLAEGASCIWQACDPLTTLAVRAVDTTGARLNCGRVYKAGVPVLKADQAGYERYLALAQTPQEHGGCAGCRFWLVCKGNCPGTAIDGDWRNRSSQCQLWFGLLEHVERGLRRQGLLPISRAAIRTKAEQVMAEAWAAGQTLSVQAAVQAALAGHVAAGDRPHGDAPHGDAPHGDAPHGDHTDAPQPAPEAEVQP